MAEDRDRSVEATHADAAAAEGNVLDGTAAREPTGVEPVDAALARLRDLDTAPLEDHVEIFDEVQRRLHDGLTELDDER
jgi:hypothetical protein